MALLFSVAVVEKLQRAQNNVIRVICQLRKCVQIASKVSSLAAYPTVHPVENIAGITHKALSTSVPPYIDELLQTPGDDAVSAVHRCSVSLCAVDTH